MIIIVVITHHSTSGLPEVFLCLGLQLITVCILAIDGVVLTSQHYAE